MSISAIRRSLRHSIAWQSLRNNPNPLSSLNIGPASLIMLGQEIALQGGSEIAVAAVTGAPERVPRKLLQEVIEAVLVALVPMICSAACSPLIARAAGLSTHTPLASRVQDLGHLPANIQHRAALGAIALCALACGIAAAGQFLALGLRNILFAMLTGGHLEDGQIKGGQQDYYAVILKEANADKENKKTDKSKDSGTAMQHSVQSCLGALAAYTALPPLTLLLTWLIGKKLSNNPQLGKHLLAIAKRFQLGASFDLSMPVVIFYHLAALLAYPANALNKTEAWLDELRLLLFSFPATFCLLKMLDNMLFARAAKKQGVKKPLYSFAEIRTDWRSGQKEFLDFDMRRAEHIGHVKYNNKLAMFLLPVVGFFVQLLSWGYTKTSYQAEQKQNKEEQAASKT